MAPCGNGVEDSDEECDDGNNVNFDGCDEYCDVEDDFQKHDPNRLNGTPKITPYCGDGYMI